MQKIKLKNLTKRLAGLLFATVFAVGAVPSVSAHAARELVPMGTAVGIELKTPGVIVVGLENLGTAERPSSPAKAAGVLPGDLIVRLNGAEVGSAEEFLKAVSTLEGSEIPLTVLRGEKQLQLTVKPLDTENGPKLGLCIRDSVTGVGTMTFFDPESGLFGALGHPISDADTNVIMPLGSGSIMDATIVGVHQGIAGRPGELCGVFDLSHPTGKLLSNGFAGIFGTVSAALPQLSREALPVAAEEEIKVGPATILCSVSGKAVEEYAVEITRLYHGDPDGRCLTLKVTDEKLLGITGGIVQGMSGSPILQDGKLVGAVTHVLLSDPTRGYGIYISAMLEQGESALAEQRAA
ncbi:MAG: SpoIVB peptidase [Firmicutes bacterium]|nr:SpoIVB peptidase [Bacillota bacterium]